MHVFAASRGNFHGSYGRAIFEDARVGRKCAAREFVAELDGDRHVEGFPVQLHAFARRDIATRDQDVVVGVQQQ
jgi:hypothetical protein